MSDFIYEDVSQTPRPSAPLPADHIFVSPSSHEPGWRDFIRQVTEWCTEQLGPATALDPMDDDQQLQPGEAWGIWPGGTLFIREPHAAMWFKLTWC